MTSRRTGRPRAQERDAPAQTDAEHAIAMQRAAILRSLPVQADIAFVAAALKDLGAMHERKALIERPFYSVQRLVERYGLARKTVERLPIPRLKIGNAVRYAASDVEAYETTCRTEKPNDAT